jgi:hypothetical protein
MPTKALAQMGRPKSLIRKDALCKKKRHDATSLPLDAIHELAKIPDLQEYYKDATQSEKERIITFLRTFNSEAVVSQMFGICRRQVERAVNHNRGIMDNAKMARNAAIAGLAEDKAIETLRKLNVDNVPDERKGRLVKDLVDSASIAHESVNPPEKEKDENVMELIFRVKQHAKQFAPKPKQADDDNGDDDGDIIEGEVVEQPQIQEKTP